MNLRPKESCFALDQVSNIDAQKRFDFFEGFLVLVPIVLHFLEVKKDNFMGRSIRGFDRLDLQRDYFLNQMTIFFSPLEKNCLGLVYMFTLLILKDVPVMMIVLRYEENQAIYKEDENRKELQVNPVQHSLMVKGSWC